MKALLIEVSLRKAGLTISELTLLSSIRELSSTGDHCLCATQHYLAELTGISVRTIGRAIKHLIELDLVRETKRKYNGNIIKGYECNDAKYELMLQSCLLEDESLATRSGQNFRQNKTKGPPADDTVSTQIGQNVLSETPECPIPYIYRDNIDNNTKKLKILDEVLKFYNSEIDRNNSSMVKASAIGNINSIRNFDILQRVSEYGLENVKKAVTNATTSKFLNGGGKQKFKADLAWIMSTEKFIRVLEGFYNQNFNIKEYGNNRQNESEQLRMGTFDVGRNKAEDYLDGFN